MEIQESFDDDAPLHEIDSVEEIEYTNHRGKKCVRRHITWRRSKRLEESLEQERLGFLHGVDPYRGINDAGLACQELFFVAPTQEIAVRLIVARLKRNRRSHLVVTSQDILGDYLSDGDARAERFRDGYAEHQQLFLLHGYSQDPPNKVLASVITQVCGGRRFRQRHIWLFMPHGLREMSERLKDGHPLLSLSWLPEVGSNLLVEK